MMMISFDNDDNDDDDDDDDDNSNLCRVNDETDGSV